LEIYLGQDEQQNSTMGGNVSQSFQEKHSYKFNYLFSSFVSILSSSTSHIHSRLDGLKNKVLFVGGWKN
jgi:hypothetical protein